MHRTTSFSFFFLPRLVGPTCGGSYTTSTADTPGIIFISGKHRPCLPAKQMMHAVPRSYLTEPAQATRRSEGQVFRVDSPTVNVFSRARLAVNLNKLCSPGVTASRHVLKGWTYVRVPEADHLVPIRLPGTDHGGLQR